MDISLLTSIVATFCQHNGSRAYKSELDEWHSTTISCKSPANLTKVYTQGAIIFTLIYISSIPRNPTPAATASCLTFGPIAVSKNGVPLFNPNNINSQNAVLVEVFDSCNGHPDNKGRQLLQMSEYIEDISVNKKNYNMYSNQNSERMEAPNW